MHSIVTTFRGAIVKVEVANFCAAMDTLIDQDAGDYTCLVYCFVMVHNALSYTAG